MFVVRNMPITCHMQRRLSCSLFEKLLSLNMYNRLTHIASLRLCASENVH